MPRVAQDAAARTGNRSPMEPKKRLGELLIEAGVIDETQLQSALGHQRRWGMKLGQALLDLKLVSEPQVVAALSRKFGYEVANLAALKPGPLLDAALKLVPRDVAAKHTLLPVAADTSSVTVAMADPTNIAVVDELSFRTGRRVRISIAGERELSQAVRRLYFGDEARRGPEPIAFDDSDAAVETTSDPYAALPEPLRASFVGPGPAAPRPPTPAPGRGAAAPATAFRPAPPPPVAAPPLAQPAAFRTPPPPVSAPLPSSVVDLAELAPAPTTPAPPGISPREAALADAIERVTREAPHPGGAALRVAAAMVRLLVKKGYFTEVEFLAELKKR